MNKDELPPEMMRLEIIKVSKIAMMTVACEQFQDPFDAASWTPKMIVGSVRSQFGDQAAEAAKRLPILNLH
jgi:hypothetical protein